MNSGLAVVLGAVIALTGSALIPWLRDGLTQRRARIEGRRLRREEALTDLLEKNTTLGFFNASDEGQAARITAFADRAHAAARLVLAVDEKDRVALSRMLHFALPFVPDSRRNGTEVGWRASTFTDLMVRWSAGELSTEELLPQWRKRVAARARDLAEGSPTA